MIYKQAKHDKNKFEKEMLHVVLNIEYNLKSQFSSWNSILLNPRFYPIQLEELQKFNYTKDIS